MFWRRKSGDKAEKMGNVSAALPLSSPSSVVELRGSGTTMTTKTTARADDTGEVENLLSALSLKGQELFAKAVAEPQEHELSLAGDKRRRPQASNQSLHKELRAGASNNVVIIETIAKAPQDDDSESSEQESLPSEIYDDDEPGAQNTQLGTVPGVDKKRKNRGAWTPEQDEALRAAVERHQGKNWKSIAREVPGNRTHIQCLQRWGKVLKPGLVKGPWTEEEDDLLRKFVPYEPKGNWVAVAQHIPGRTAKQCRERWSLCLDPAIRKDPWTPEEDDLLLKLHDLHGNAWALIAKHLPGRTENATKSRFKSIERKRDRAWTPSEDAAIIRGKAEEKKWSAIAASLPHSRSKHAVKMRWKELVLGDPSLQRFDSGRSNTTSEESGSGSNLRALKTMDSLPPPIESSPSYVGLRATGYDNVKGLDALDQNAISLEKKLPHSLSSDKLVNLKLQRNESFEEWLAKEAGGIVAVPMMVAGSGGSFGTGSFRAAESPTRSYVMSPSGVLTFDDGLDDLDIV